MNRNFRRAGMPPLHSRLIERPRLHEKLAGWHHHRVVTITAPAGFGKSTYTAMWLRATGMHPAWMALHHECDDPHVFIADLTEALRLPRSSKLNLQTAAHTGRTAPHDLLRALLDALPRPSAPRILVVDDAHLAVHTADLLQRLIDTAPPTLHLVFLTRSRLALHTPPDSLHLDVEDMRFDRAEFQAFVERTRLSDLPPDQLARIERSASGWIIALQLMSISASATSELDRILPALHPSDAAGVTSGFLLEYLDQNVLHSIDERLRSFLTYAAVAPEFDVPLAAALADVSAAESRRLLHTALDANLLLTMQPAPRPRHGVFRMHPLFRDFLLRELNLHIGRLHMRRLQRIVASHFEEQDRIDYALDYFLHAEDEQSAMRLVRTRGRRALFDYEFVALRRWHERLGANHIAADLELVLQAAWLEQLAAGGVRPHTVQIAARQCDAQSCSVEQETELLTLESYAHFCADDRASAQRAAQRAVALPQPASPFVDGHRLAMLAVTTLPVDHAAALSAARASAAAFARVGGAFGAIAPHGMFADFLKRSGEVVAALRTLENYVHAFKLTHREFTTEAVIARLAYAQILYWVDQIAEARAELQLVMRSENSPIAPLWLTAMARLYLQLCTAADHSAISLDAQTDTEEWQRVSAVLPPPLRSELAFLRVTRDALRKDHAAMRGTLAAADFELSTLQQLPFKAQLAVLSAEIHCDCRDPRIAPALQHLRTAAAAQGDFETRVRAGLLLAAHCTSQSAHSEARDLLAELLPVVEHTRAHRLVLDCPALEPSLAHSNLTFAAQLFQRFQQSRGDAHPFNLTHREFEILQLTASGIVADEIARRINMTRASVYTYLSRIYRKMNVHRRADALHLYRQIEIQG